MSASIETVRQIRHATKDGKARLQEGFPSKGLNGRKSALEQDEKDYFGDYLTKILNESPEFNTLQTDDNKLNQSIDTIRPLPSSSTFSRFVAKMNPKQILHEIILHFQALFLFLTKEQRTIIQGVRILLAVTLLNAVFLSLIYRAFFSMMIRALTLSLTLASVFVIDVNEIKSAFPKIILLPINGFVTLLSWIDSYLFLGFRYANRDQNKKQGHSNPTNLPPTSDPTDLSSNATWKHLNAINFCYSMLKVTSKTHPKTRLKYQQISLISVNDEVIEAPLVESPSAFDKLIQTHRLCDDGQNRVGSLVSTIVVPTTEGCISHDTRSAKATNILNLDSFLSTSDDDQSSSFENDDMSLKHDSTSLIDSNSRKDRKMRDGRAIENGVDLNWAEVGAQIGMRIISSEHVQRVVASQDTAERIQDITKNMGQRLRSPNHKSNAAQRTNSNTYTPDQNSLGDRINVQAETRLSSMPIKPVHSLWTSASAVVEISTLPKTEELSDPILSLLPRVRRISSTDIDFDSLKSQGSVNFDNSCEHSRQEFNVDNQFSISKCCELNLPRIHELEKNICPIETLDNGTEVLLVPNDDRNEHISSLPLEMRFATGLNSCINKTRREVLRSGVKMVVPLIPTNPEITNKQAGIHGRFFQMATVISSKRILISTRNEAIIDERGETNCLSITVSLDKSFLRNGGFARLTLRILDSWSERYMPRHSKFPIGCCVATSFGLGVLVGWRVEDDCHIVRALWKRQGPGSGKAYLNRNALHSIVEAAVGFRVETDLGKGVVISYISAGKDFVHGRYNIRMTCDGRLKGKILEFNRQEISNCHGPEFVPLIELIREAAEYQIQVDAYQDAFRNQLGMEVEQKKWLQVSKGLELLWISMLRAVKDDDGFDAGLNHVFTSMITFLDQHEKSDSHLEHSESKDKVTSLKEIQASSAVMDKDPYAWFVNDLYGGIFTNRISGHSDGIKKSDVKFFVSAWNQQQYEIAYAIIHTLLKTVTIAAAECKDMPNLKLSLAIVHEFLLFVQTVMKIQQANVSAESVELWERTLGEIVDTFGPVRARIEKICIGIADRMTNQGNKAKIQVLRLVDILVSNEKLLLSLERGEWMVCLKQLEDCLVLSGIISRESSDNYHKTIRFVLNHFLSSSINLNAAKRNHEKMVYFAKALKWAASPRRSVLQFIRRDSTLEVAQRVFERVFRNDPDTSRIIIIHASNMKSFRHLRILKDFTVTGKLWIPMLDAADQEFSWMVTKMPEKSKSILSLLSRLFSLGVIHFHQIARGDLTSDWMEFLMSEEAIQHIQEINKRLILQVESFSKDIKEMMLSIPFFPTIEDDILKLVDEIDVDRFLKEASDAMTNPEELGKFFREKIGKSLQRFLNYLPKMSIPLEQRDLGDGWVISCYGQCGGDLKLSDVSIKRENFMCQILGGEKISFTDINFESPIRETEGNNSKDAAYHEDIEMSILDHINVLIQNAKKHGCWKTGFGGVGQVASDPYAASVLKGQQISAVLNAGIELWSRLEIDDDELLEIAIKDISYQIQLHQSNEDGNATYSDSSEDSNGSPKNVNSPTKGFVCHRFNPLTDPTLIYLDIKNFTLNLDKFRFRIEKRFRNIFDPVFEGWGKLCVEDLSLTVRIECRKESMMKMEVETMVPVLYCRELDISMKKVILEVKDTGADWILNTAVKNFSKGLTSVVEANLQEQVRQQVQATLQTLNSYLRIHPDSFCRLLGIKIDDLQDFIVAV